MCSLFVGLLLAVGSNAVTAPSSQCAYLDEYFETRTLLPSLVPSVNSKCVAALNPATLSSLCIPECQSLYSTYSQCTTAWAANERFADDCGTSYCATITQQDSALVNAVNSYCNNGSYCSSSCQAAISALEQSSGCCRYSVLNGPKVVCGQKPIAPCPNVLNSGSVAAPSGECVYLLEYGIPSATFLAACITGSSSCIAECQPFYALYGRCLYGKTVVDYLASSNCGEFGSQNCSWLHSNRNLYSLSACSNSTYCSPSCLAAIAAAEKYGGCCYAQDINGPKALCGQQPIAPCSTIVSSTSTSTSGSVRIGFNILLMLFMVAVQHATY